MYEDLDWETDFELQSDGESRVYTRRRIRGYHLTLDKFESFESKLTDEHRLEIKRLAADIQTSYHNKEPFSHITIEGHAAYWSGAPNPAIPYTVQARNRAVAVKTALVEELRIRKMLNKVDIATPVGRGTSNPVASNTSKLGRAKNRRVEVIAEEFDPLSFPTRWMCEIRMKYSGNVYRPDNLKYAPYLAGTQFVGSGVLISDRHVLTAAHNVRALQKKGDRLIWKNATEIRVTPSRRGGNHLVKRPFGTWKGIADKVITFPGYTAAVTPDDYQSGKPDRALKKRFLNTDLAIIELKPKRRRTLGATEWKKIGEPFGWWGSHPSFTIGVGNQIKILKRMERNPAICRVPGFRNGFPDFRKGTIKRLGNGVYSDDVNLIRGHSGSPYWIKVGSKNVLLAIHHGDNVVIVRPPKGPDILPRPSHSIVVDWGILLSPAKEIWISSVISPQRA